MWGDKDKDKDNVSERFSSVKRCKGRDDDGEIGANYVSRCDGQEGCVCMFLV
jgi:hypothetical protein